MESKETKKKPIPNNHKQPLRFVLILIAIGVVAIVIYACRTLWWDSRPFGFFITNLSLGLLIAGSALTMGCLTGFIFAIPKQSKIKDSNLSRPIKGYIGNDNLIEISDWLTKIIVGVSLTQLTSIPRYLKLMGEYVGITFGGANTGAVGSAAIVVYFLICGFMFTYLWTRIYFARILDNAEVDEGLNVQLEVEKNRSAELEKDLNTSKDEVKILNAKLEDMKSK